MLSCTALIAELVEQIGELATFDQIICFNAIQT